jgi:hypothetical protein
VPTAPRFGEITPTRRPGIPPQPTQASPSCNELAANCSITTPTRLPRSQSQPLADLIPAPHREITSLSMGSIGIAAPTEVHLTLSLAQSFITAQRVPGD